MHWPQKLPAINQRLTANSKKRVVSLIKSVTYVHGTMKDGITIVDARSIAVARLSLFIYQESACHDD
jgi:hypothetical protein